jgi:hypothetical protein
MSLGTVHRHIFDHQAKHMQALISTVEKEYTQKVNEARFAFSREDNPEFKSQILDNQIAELKKVKGRVVER